MMNDKTSGCCTPKGSASGGCGSFSAILLGLLGGALAFGGLWMATPLSGQSLIPPIATEDSAPTGVLKGLAVMDLQRVLAQSKAGKDLQTQVDAVRESLRKEAEKDEKTLENLEKKLTAAQDAGDKAAFISKRAQFEKSLAEARRDIMVRKRALDESLSKAIGELRAEVQNISARLGKERGYALITTSQGAVIVSKELDITADVMAELDKSLPSVKLNIKAAER